MIYFDELKRAMTWLGQQDKVVMLGQAVREKGTAMRNTLVGVPEDKLIEFPVCENLQAGVANGLALAGKVPVSIYPRWNFFLLAIDQVVNHLDKIPEISDYKTKVIIRTGVGSISPMNPQAQHTGDFTDAYRLMLKNVEVIRLDYPEQIFPAYQHAYNRTDGKSTILVEWGDAYDNNWKFSPDKL